MRRTEESGPSHDIWAAERRFFVPGMEQGLPSSVAETALPRNWEVRERAILAAAVVQEEVMVGRALEVE